MIDLAVCEWNPGSNRSVVSIESAAAHIPVADRKPLIERFNRRQFDDTVRIGRDAITSDTGSLQYDAVIANMNFGHGDRCRRVTRARWRPTDVQGAVVFIVNGRAYGYAAVCGNLFELVGQKHSTPPAPQAGLVPPETADVPPERLPTVPPLAWPGVDDSATANSGFAVAPEVGHGSQGWSPASVQSSAVGFDTFSTASMAAGFGASATGTLGFGGLAAGDALPGVLNTQKTVARNVFGNTELQDAVAVQAVPEPTTYALMLAGLGAIGWLARRRRNPPR